MKKNKLERLDLTLYSETLSNGLRVYIVPKENVNGIYATLSTKFGSVYDEFIPLGKKKFTKVPLGVAHFLEHKMFEQKDGIDPFTFYSERGCDANANTSNYKTTYLFSGANSFENNLNYLLDYVQDPYFTDENVEKEKGIIEQEINMYKDDPFMNLYDGIIFNSFVNHPIKYPIAGTKESVYSITKDDLYTCYNTFYHPSNMFLAITGNVDPEETINLIKLNQEEKKFDKKSEVKIKEYEEADKVQKKSQKITMNLEIPKIGLGYKINCTKFNKDINEVKTYFSMILDLKFGSTSLFLEELKEKNLILGNIEVSLINTDKHILIMLMAETKYPSKLAKLIEEEMSSLKVTEEEFERKKKVRKSSCIYKSDNIYSINNKIVSNIMNYDKVILDDYKKIDEYKIKDLQKILKSANFENKTLYIIDKS